VTDYSHVTLRKELCMFTWHGSGKRPTFVTDAGTPYTVTNAVNLGASLKPDTAYRMSVIYTPTAEDTTCCTLTSLSRIPMLGDSTRNTIKTDTLDNVKALWLAGGYINLTLAFKDDHTQSPIRQAFGYRVIPQQTTPTTQTHKSLHLSLLYLLNGAAEYYTESVTFSIHPTTLGLQKGDTLFLHTDTKNTGPETFTLQITE
ncbi:MAG: hypothetical protein HUK00_09540, partial [Bacteroidaceae bacterium]|nr:hypothetical protein [Bacteroidaceae bacterium]